MQSVSAKEIAMRLEYLYTTKVASYPQYQELRRGCRRWFGEAFENTEEFQMQYLTSDDAFLNVLSACYGSERRMIDFFRICDKWALWHFDLTINHSIQAFKLESTNERYLAPASDIQFFKKFASPFRCGINH